MTTSPTRFTGVIMTAYRTETDDLIIRGYDPAEHRNRTTTRIFPAEWLTPLSPPEPEYSVYGEDPANDRRWKKFRREQAKVTAAATLAALSAAGVDITGLTLRFSRKAGCSCSCSPGFIASRVILLPDEVTHSGSVRAYDIFIKPAPQPAPRPEGLWVLFADNSLRSITDNTEIDSILSLTENYNGHRLLASLGISSIEVYASDPARPSAILFDAAALGFDVRPSTGAGSTHPYFTS